MTMLHMNSLDIVLFIKENIVNEIFRLIFTNELSRYILKYWYIFGHAYLFPSQKLQNEIIHRNKALNDFYCKNVTSKVTCCSLCSLLLAIPFCYYRNIIHRMVIVLIFYFMCCPWRNMFQLSIVQEYILCYCWLVVGKFISILISIRFNI